VGAGGKEPLQARRCPRDGVGPNNASNIKTRCPRGADQFRFKGGQI
jgi:hypothetical protein